MIALLDFLPVITIFAVGYGLWSFLNKYNNKKMRFTELYNISLLLGTTILIIPLILIGIQPEGVISISIVTVSFNDWVLVFFLFGLIITIIIIFYALRKFLGKLEDYTFSIEPFKNLKLILILILVLEYVFLELILPLRGFDALYYYFPEVEVFYQTGRITEFNYLSFLPVVKSPLNVLLYLYAYYITSNLSIQLFPILFFFGLIFLVYDFSKETFQDSNFYLIAIILLLTLPFMYWLMVYWAFYQDLYLGFFYSITLYFSYKSFKREKSDVIYLVLIIFGIIATILTKITGWTLLLILLIWLPTGKHNKIMRISILLFTLLFLALQIATRIFLGGIIIIIGGLGLAIYFILKEEENYTHPFHFCSLSVLIGGLLGSFWLIDRIRLSNSVLKELIELYFKLEFNFITDYPQAPSDALLSSLERMHGVNFVSATLILFLGTIFVLPWIILKVSSLKNFRPISPFLTWIAVFFCIWATYYLNGSIRYLTPIIVPMILCLAWGFCQFTSRIDDQKIENFLIIFFGFLGCLCFYYLIPINSLIISSEIQKEIGISYNQAALNYYLHPEILILIAAVVIMIFIKVEKAKFLDYMKNKKFNRTLNFCMIFFLCLIILIPITVQSYLLFLSGGNLEEFAGLSEYEYRSDYQDIVTVIQQQNNPWAAIMTVRTPGLQFFIKQPVIDIYYQRNFFPQDPFFSISNLTVLITILQYPLNYTHSMEYIQDFSFSIKYIVVPSYNNIYYDIYRSDILLKSTLFQSLNNEEYFTLLFENSGYKLFEVRFPLYN